MASKLGRYGRLPDAGKGNDDSSGVSSTAAGTPATPSPPQPSNSDTSRKIRGDLLPLNLDRPKLPRACQAHIAITVLMGFATVAMVMVTFWPHNSSTVQTVGQNATSYLLEVEMMMNETKSGVSDDLAANVLELTDNLTNYVDSFMQLFSKSVDNVTIQMTNQRDHLTIVANALNDTLRNLSILQAQIKHKTEQLLVILPENLTDVQREFQREMEAGSQLISSVWEVTNKSQDEIVTAQMATTKTLELLSDLKQKVPESMSDDMSALQESQVSLSTVLGRTSDGMKHIVVVSDENARIIESIATTVSEDVTTDLGSLYSGQNELDDGQVQLQSLQHDLSETLTGTISEIGDELVKCGLSPLSPGQLVKTGAAKMRWTNNTY